VRPPLSSAVRALTIASSDSGGGAGVQADLKAFARCGVHGMSVIVALTAQNTVGVSAIHQCPPDFVRAQLDAVFSDLPPAAVKTGMLFSEPIIATVAAALAGRHVPLVLDPVMIASSGARLLEPDAVKTLVEILVARAPGHAVELRIPPYTAVQVLDGPRHTRGTPPNVVEMGPRAFLDLATGRASWHDAVRDGQVRASGERADLSALLPLLS